VTLRVSVVIPTYRRPGLLARCLAAVLQQDLDPAEYEVIVVDDEPGEATRRLVEMHIARSERVPEPAAVVTGGGPSEAVPGRPATPRLRYIANPGVRGPAAARNLGWRAAEGEVIAVTDDDCIPSAGWLRAGLEALEGGAAGATGRLVVPRPEPPTDYERMVGLLERSPFVTANCFYRRTAVEAVGGFDERFRTAWREDSDLWFRLEEAGFPLVEAPDAIVTHPVRSAPWGVSLREQRKSQHNALLYKKHPRHYRERIGPVPNWRYLAIVGALIGAPAALALGARRSSAVMATAWLAQTAAFAAMRMRGTSPRPSHRLEMLVTSALIPPLSIFWRLRGAVRYRVPFI
jgi:GT2 family glycosyltransferase